MYIYLLLHIYIYICIDLFKHTHTHTHTHTYMSFSVSVVSLCDPMNCSMQGFPVLHCLPKPAQGQSIDSVMPSNHLILCCPLLLLLLTFFSISFFPNESALHIRWPKDWSFNFISDLPKNIQDCFPLGLIGLISLLFQGFSRVLSTTTVQKHQLFDAQPSLWFNSHIHT